MPSSTGPGEDTDELRAGAALAFAAADGIVGIAARMQRAITRRSAGPFAAVPGAIADAVYTGVRAGFSASARVADAALGASGLGTRHRPLQDTEWGRRVGGVLNGAVGDRLAERFPALATPLRLRAHGRDVVPDAESLAAHYPDATGHIAVFLHGLIEDEDWWRPREPAGAPGFGERLAEDLGVTPLYVRYNTGRHVSDNARELSALLNDILRAWPAGVARISLIGHSMGGLVARGAVHLAAAEGEPWLMPLREVICLGSPHQGSYVERGANLASWALSRFAESEPLSVLFTERSSGIKDLRYGYVDETEWAGHDPDALRRASRRPDCRTADGAGQRFLAVTLAPDPESLRGKMFGDLLVLPASATDTSQQAQRQTLGQLGHFDMLTHPRVYAQLRDWLTTDSHFGA
jgi:triacylglycerol lipase